MRWLHAFGALTLGLTTTAVWSQATPQPSSSGPLGGFRSPSNNPGSGAGDMPGSAFPATSAHAAAGVVKGAYGLDLSQRIAAAQKLVDEVDRGRALTAADTRHIRDLMREDFVAWNKQFDLLPTAYRTERDRWLLAADALSPNDWAKQRLRWLEAQRDWILSRGG